jgi:hypothetical protein
VRGGLAFSELAQALRDHTAATLEPNSAPRVDLADVTSDLGLALWSMSGVTIPYGSYGWTREAAPLRPYAETEPTDVPTHGPHTHQVTPRGFRGGDVVRVEFLWSNRHPLVTAIVEFPGS